MSKDADVIVKLKSSDDKEFEVAKKVAEMSVTVKNMLSDLGWEENEEAFPLPGIEGSTLEKVIEYCEKHCDDPASSQQQSQELTEPTGFDAEFLRDIDQTSLFNLILAANFMDIKPLLDLTCKKVALMIKGKSVEEIRDTFNITNDFTPQEEEQVRRENSWLSDRS
eukprot:m.77338 g.77338  ORF g.77338 m.77338 type:complete len:166 (-) comp11913_c0_seq3:1167-1664(-)